MQWNATPYAGFSAMTPWLPLSDDFAQENVVNLEADTRSILSLYKALIEIRKKLPQLMSGDYVPIAAQGDLLLYRRQREGATVVIALNLGAEPVSIASDAAGLDGEILLSTFLDRQGEKIQGVLDLRGNEGAIIGASPSTWNHKSVLQPILRDGAEPVIGRAFARPVGGLLRMRSHSLKHNNLILRSERRERLEAWAASDSPISHSQYQRIRSPSSR
jgi:hypothetical protein